jgi:hypothetical protein
MTSAEIQEMGAGRTIDVLIAARVMGWKPDIVDVHNEAVADGNTRVFDGWEDAGTGQWCAGLLPYYSTQMEAAWDILARQQWLYTLTATTESFRVSGASAKLLAPQEQAWSEASATLEECDGDSGRAQALAICRASLLLVAYLERRERGAGR